MKSCIFLFLCLLFVPQITGLTIDSSIDSKVIVKEYSHPLKLTIRLGNVTAGNYNVFTLADFLIEPSNIFSIATPEFEKTFLLTPFESLNVDGFYTFTYTINQRDVKKFDEKLTIKFVNLNDILEVYSASIDPAKSNDVDFFLENKEDVKLENVTARFKSVLFDEEKTFSIGPRETVKFTIKADEEIIRKTKAGVYIMSATFETPKGTREIEGNLYLGEKVGISTEEDSSGLLIRRQTISKTNVGNTVESAQITITKNIFSRLFTTFNIEPTITERRSFIIEYTWVKGKLEPTEKLTIQAKSNYVLPFFIIIFAIIFIFGVKRFSETKLEITKSVAPVKTKNDEFALRVTINVKAKKSVENVTLIDKIPPIVKLYRKFGFVKPDKIDPVSRRVHWSIGDLLAKEERTFTYVVYSKVGIIGKFSLPGALGVFEKDGNIHEIESNQVFFLNEQIKGEN